MKKTLFLTLFSLALVAAAASQLGRAGSVGAAGGSVATQVGAGHSHSCALLSGGAIKCWGRNAYGQLGDGVSNHGHSDAGYDFSPTPVSVSGITGATQVSAAGSHACALLSGGAIKCWGNGGEGELGNNSTNDSSTPVTVSGISNATAITAGGELDTHRLLETLIHTVPGGHTCALFSGGTIKCWGYNYYGQLGSGTYGDSATPVAVTGISGASAISAGADHVCALVSGGTVKCWGDGYEGQLGNSSDSSTPVAVAGITGASAISAGGDESCALLSTRVVKCWGWGGDGQLGNGTYTEYNYVPVQVSGITTATQVSVGYDHACVLLSGGTVKCWGANDKGQLGNATTTSSSTPVAVNGITNATAITSGHSHSCALLSGGAVRCWGWNVDGQLGNNSATNSSTPVTVSGITGGASATIAFSAASYSVGEAGGSAVITIKRSGSTTSAASVLFKTANGSATAGSDYTAVSQTVSFAAGVTSKTVSVAIIDDSSVESDETVQLSLSSPSSGASLGSPHAATLTIIDNDTAPGDGSGSASGKISSAHLTKKSFKRSQAAKVKLLYSFSPKSEHFSYLLSLKKKAKWLTVQSVAKAGSFEGSYTMTVKKLFGGKAIKAGSYRLKLSADKNSKLLTFKVT